MYFLYRQVLLKGRRSPIARIMHWFSYVKRRAEILLKTFSTVSKTAISVWMLWNLRLVTSWRLRFMQDFEVRPHALWSLLIAGVEIQTQRKTVYLVFAKLRWQFRELALPQGFPLIWPDRRILDLQHRDWNHRMGVCRNDNIESLISTSQKREVQFWKSTRSHFFTRRNDCFQLIFTEVFCVILWPFTGKWNASGLIFGNCNKYLVQ